MTEEKRLKTYPAKLGIKSAASYPDLLAASLRAYSRYDEVFGRNCKELILQNIKAGRTEELAVDWPVRILLPENRTIAAARAVWLIKHQDLMSEQEQTRLYSWALAGENSAPQQIVVGFVGVAIPGPTLGLISKRKKITMIIKKEARMIKTAALVEKTTALSLDIVSQALAQANGEAAHIEPDVSDWFFGERGLRLFEAEAAEFEMIKQELKDAKIINSIAEVKGREAIMAVSPALNSYYPQTNWRLKAL